MNKSLLLLAMLLVAPVASPLMPIIARAQQPNDAFPSVAAAIRALGADEFQTRELASRYLWYAGAAAQKDLELAIKHDDPEVRLRASLVLRKVRLGITPDTPAETQQLINRFYDGDRNGRQQVISELRQKGSYTTLFALLQGETDAASRQLFFSTMQADMQRLAPQMVASSDWSLLEQWLDLGKATEAGQVHFITYALLRGKLNEEIKRVEDELEKRRDDSALVNRLALMYRAGGNDKKALEVIQRGPSDAKLVVAMYREQMQWDQARASISPLPNKVPRDTMADSALQAALARLSGKATDSLEATQAFSKLVKTEDVWFGAKTLLLNERPQLALDLLKDGLQPMAFDLLSQLQQHQEALDLAGIKDDTSFNQAWLNGLTGQQPVRTSRSVDRFTYAVSIAAQLRMLGKKQQYDDLRALLESTATLDDQRGQYWHQLARLERQPGRQQELLHLYGRGVAQNPQSVWSQLFGKKFARAQTWWEALDADVRWQDPQERLNAVAVSMQPATFARHVEVDWPAVEKHVSAKADNLGTAAAVRVRLHAALAEAWAARSDKLRAEEHWKAAVAADPTTATDYGDVLLAEQRWNEAATQYQRAYELNQGNSLALFLQSVALIRAGKEAEGKKLQSTASLMALDTNARYLLATALQDRNLRAEALEQWQLLRRTGGPDHSYVMIANQHLGNLIAEKEPLAAADHWEQLRFHLLKPALNLVEQSGYLNLAVSLHRTRARGLLSAGDKAKALEELAICEAMLPGHIKLVEDFTAPLRKAGMEQEADALFERTYQVYQQGVKQFPESAALHNQAAWTAAIAGRRLDEALAFAQNAVKLAPESAAYADTLAEVHFARGDREQALTWARKAASLAPETKAYDERLQSFSTRELPAGSR
ncbi:hypothetical protein ETAA8_38580 [Anatilimnocola aggregata]|uniref:Tetratricopeptide repeat protein n=1 Tax=Anatilimnocola aggregata TaxID=2528021 RepID=A0A517YEV4_9BACT|nr:hypothetical protein [Anatilimnocola aggregata]QDU28753.1 hypothetical protein ETAA8_38580 [Anatilimnocola aggregata]